MTNPLQSIQTPDLLQERLARLKAEFPDLFTNEGKLNPVELQRLTHEEGHERFDFTWWGKAAAKRKAFTPTTAALRYDAARSVNPDLANGNAIIEGENLEVLKLLLNAYRGQVKCIYIDPPYNTGNDFVYKDNFAEGKSLLGANRRDPKRRQAQQQHPSRWPLSQQLAQHDLPAPAGGAPTAARRRRDLCVD